MIDAQIEILLVDDNPDDAELTMRMFKKNNILNHVIYLKDGEEALDFIFCMGKYSERNVAKKECLILLDLNMPKINGVQVLKKLHTNDQTKAIPVMVFISDEDDPAIEECRQLGVVGFVAKPLKIEDFTKALSLLGLGG
ncbi:MAG: two-component system response regulator [Chitinophagaceae bacterium]|nr:two-component system response regulator [Chitinophagaceae bacterium]